MALGLSTWTKATCFGAQWRERGQFRRVKGMMPSVTNANNASICCGVLPEQHGITGNSYFDERTGREEYMETADLLLSPTLFQRAKKQGVASALLSCKKKTTTLLSPGADLILSAETPTQDWVRRLGSAPDILVAGNQLLAHGGRNPFAQDPPRSRLPLHPHDRLPDAYLAPPEAKESKEHLVYWINFSAKRPRPLLTPRSC